MKLDFLGIGETNFPDWSCMVATQVTDIPVGLTFLGGGGVKKRASYWRHVNTPLPEKMWHNTQCCDDPTIQPFMWGDPSDLKSENNIKGSILDGLHVRNKVTLQDKRLMMIPFMIIPHLQLPIKHVSQTIRYFYNEQQVPCQG